MGHGERKCYIHIGAHKTGTSSIQLFLGQNRARFAAAGVLFPLAGSYRNRNVYHHELAHELRGLPMQNPANGGLDAFADELRESDAHTAFISSEDLSSLWSKPSALVRLRDAVTQAGFKPLILIYLRPQVSQCIAIYAESVRQGYRTAFATYLDDVLTHGHYVWHDWIGPPFDYNELLAPFAEVFGRESIIARAYRPAARDTVIFAEFVRLLLPGTNITEFTLPLGRENRSPDFGSILTWLGTGTTLEETIRFAPLGIRETLRLGRRFHAANVKMKARYRVELPVFAARDLALALPIRRNVAKTRALAVARRALVRNDA